MQNVSGKTGRTLPTFSFAKKKTHTQQKKKLEIQRPQSQKIWPQSFPTPSDPTSLPLDNPPKLLTLTDVMHPEGHLTSSTNNNPQSSINNQQSTIHNSQSTIHNKYTSSDIYIYTYIFICLHVYVYTYIYIYRPAVRRRTN